LNVLRKIALPLLRNTQVKRHGLKKKMFLASMDVSFLEKVMFMGK
jgi:hypothetical protein